MRSRGVRAIPSEFCKSLVWNGVNLYKRVLRDVSSEFLSSSLIIRLPHIHTTTYGILTRHTVHQALPYSIKVKHPLQQPLHVCNITPTQSVYISLIPTSHLRWKHFRYHTPCRTTQHPPFHTPVSPFLTANLLSYLLAITIHLRVSTHLHRLRRRKVLQRDPA